MTLQIAPLERLFKYNNRELTDPNLEMSPLEVLKFYSNTFPELINSNVQGPVFMNDKAVYEFKISIGTKG